MEVFLDVQSLGIKPRLIQAGIVVHDDSDIRGSSDTRIGVSDAQVLDYLMSHSDLHLITKDRTFAKRAELEGIGVTFVDETATMAEEVLRRLPTGDPPWLKSGSRKANLVRKFLNGELFEWRRSQDSAVTRHDFFLGCYGNPDKTDWVFVPEIPSQQPKDLVLRGYPTELAWTSAWNVTVSDLLFRVALKEHDFIPSAISDEPWWWNCWITDFVKSSRYAGEWSDFRKTDEGKKMIRESATLLEGELRILEPKFVVFVGARSERYFERHLAHLKNELGIRTCRVDHYAQRDKSPERMRRYLEEFDKSIIKLRSES